MLILVLGVLLWAAAHALPIQARGLRARLIDRLGGEKRYKGAFALVIVLSLVLIVIGWRLSGYHENIYDADPAMKHVTGLGMAAAFLLFGAAKAKTNVKRFIRHPQLLAVVVWGGAHLLSNGEARSVVLFAGMALWAASAIVMINARDGAWVKPAPFPRSGDIRWLVISLVMLVVFVLLHPYFTGVAPY